MYVLYTFLLVYTVHTSIYVVYGPAIYVCCTTLRMRDDTPSVVIITVVIFVIIVQYRKPFVCKCTRGPCLLHMSHSFTQPHAHAYTHMAGSPSWRYVGIPHGGCFLVLGFELQPPRNVPPLTVSVVEAVPSTPNSCLSYTMQSHPHRPSRIRVL